MRIIEIFFTDKNSKEIKCEDDKVKLFIHCLQNDKFIEIQNKFYNTSCIDSINIIEIDKIF